MIQCAKVGCHKEAVCIVARPDGDVEMCWDCHEEFIATQADYVECQLTDR